MEKGGHPGPRRLLLGRIGALAATAAWPWSAGAREALAPTPADAEGPFYPLRIPADADADLTRVAGRPGAARGTPLLLSGRVLDTDGTALVGARVELWQCDATGRYHHVQERDDVLDVHFQGYGVVVTDAGGRYAFRTIRPVPYGSRPPHLHFKLAHGVARPLTTQLYPRGESRERFAGFGLSAPTARSRLEFAPRAMPSGELEATFDFVLQRSA